MFLAKMRKNRYTPALAYIQVGFKGVYITQTCVRYDTTIRFVSQIISGYLSKHNSTNDRHNNQVPATVWQIFIMVLISLLLSALKLTEVHRVVGIGKTPK